MIDKKIVKVSEANSNYEFSSSGNIFGNEFAYNVLRGYNTTLTTTSVIVFANGELTSKDTIQVVKAVWDDNPSEYLNENQELAKSVKYILIVPCFEFETNQGINEEIFIHLQHKYNAFIHSIT